ncbi:MAG: sigma-54-dependent Fis family transcriptional regulator [Thermoanaerobaculia bacterium]|nr:sigma-54-dependent Fis family transcriptional regulator [Thermoanaerobaculia bacterium]
MLAINVAALTPELMASDLFGHERGAFTGASIKRKGLLVEAGKGTVFLDEIGDLDAASQTKLLHVLEDFRVRPVGANHWETIEAHILLATNRDLEADCETGRFRRDLFERIRGLPIEIPPLREHKADIPLLTEHFLSLYNRERRARHTLPPGAVDILFRHDWPGNVRELQLAVRQAAIFAPSPSGPISKEHLRNATRRRPPRPTVLAQPHTQPLAPATEPKPDTGQLTIDPEQLTLREARDLTEAAYLKRALELAGGRAAEACKRSRMSPSQFYALLRKHGLG